MQSLIKKAEKDIIKGELVRQSGIESNDEFPICISEAAGEDKDNVFLFLGLDPLFEQLGASVSGVLMYCLK